MRDSAVVEILHDHGFSGVDLSLVSKLKRPEYYGIQLTMEARQAVGAQYKYLRGIKNQEDRMVAYMDKTGSVSSLEAMSILGILSPTKVISNLRRNPGFIVHQRWETNGKSRWVRWWLERREDERV